MRKTLSWILLICLLLCPVLSGCEKAPQVTVTTAGSDSSDHAHTDENGDGLCEQCGESVIVNFDFYVVNDLHGKLCDTSSQPGVDELSTYFQAANISDENVIILSSGDMWQGSSESNLTKGNMMTEWMNEMGFVSMTLGNHEFDWGEDKIRENAQLADFPFLAINIYDRETNQRVDYCDSSVMVEKSGVKIGIIGAIGDCYSSISGDFTKDIYFITDDALTALVKAEAAKLREQGADMIVYSLHDGYGGNDYSESATDSMLGTYYDSVLSDGYVDVVFEGHTHSSYVKQDKYGVYHLQGGGDNKGISHLEVNINYVNDTSTVTVAEFVSTDVYADYSSDPVVDELMAKYDEQVSVGTQSLGTNSYNRSGVSLRQTAAQLYYDFGMEHWGDEYPIVLGGGFFKVRSPGYLAAGDVTYSQLYMLFPFDNALVLCSIKGKDLQQKFFETDNQNYFIAYGDYGAQIKDNIDPDGTYYVVVDSYTSTYAPNHLTEIERYSEAVYTRDLLADHIREGNMES